mgnify:CR=1 FL=1
MNKTAIVTACNSKKAYMQPVTNCMYIEVQQLMEGSSRNFRVSDSEETDGWADARRSSFWDDNDD